MVTLPNAVEKPRQTPEGDKAVTGLPESGTARRVVRGESLAGFFFPWVRDRRTTLHAIVCSPPSNIGKLSVWEGVLRV